MVVVFKGKEMKLLLALALILNSLFVLAQEQSFQNTRNLASNAIASSQRYSVEDFDTRLSDKRVSDIKASVDKLFTQALEESELTLSSADFSHREFQGFLPSDLRIAHYRFVKDLLESGKVSKRQVSKWLKDHKALEAKSPPVGSSKGAIKAFWRSEYNTLFDTFFKNVRQNTPSCLAIGKNSTVGKCCQGLVSTFELGTKTQSTCKAAPGKCDNDRECCSGYCEKLDPDQAGVCRQKKICYQLHNLGDKCGDPSPFCRKGSCETFDRNISGLLQCKNTKGMCKQNDDCCSGVCQRGQCVEKRQCLICRKSKGRLKKGEACCPGYIPTPSGKCLPPIPPYVPTARMPRTKKVFYTFLNIIFPSAHAQIVKNNAGLFGDFNKQKILQNNSFSNEAEDSLTVAQKDFITKKRDACERRKDKQKCLEEVEQTEKEFVKDQFTGLTQDQMNEIEALRNQCLDDYPTAQPCQNNATESCQSPNSAYENCMKLVNAKETAHIQTNQDNGVKGVSLKREGYVDRYGIPAVTAKTYSDIDQCEFHSFNDSWRDASARERNAEVFLRAFEYVYSHKGTEDFWEDGAHGNIFTRAHKVAVRFRENRMKMIERMQLIDKEMSCKCIAIFGPGKFDSGKQDFFNSSCNAEAAELRQSLGQDLQGENDKLDAKQSKIDGTSINEDKSNNESKMAKTEEIDKGAIGISHGKLLVEFLRLRSDVQVERFANNAELEEQLDALAEYIENKDYTEVFFDRWNGRGPVREQGSPGGDSHGLYGWGYTFYSGFIGWVMAVVKAPFSNLQGKFSEAWELVFGSKRRSDRVGGKTIYATAAAGLQAAWEDLGSDDKAAPLTKDREVGTRKVNKWGKKSKAFQRYFLGPRYINEEANRGGPNVCDVKARASSCVRTAYVVDFYESGNSEQEGEPFTTFLLDPTLPLFVDESQISIKTMPKHNKNWVEMINQASEQGVSYLQTPEGGRRGTGGLSKWGETWSFRGKSFRYYRHRAEDILFPAVKNGYFVPKGKNSNQFYVPEPFGGRKNAIILGATKYATCKLLNSCPGSRGAKHLQAGEIGLGYLFESEVEAKDFAEYTYEMHYKFPKLSSKNYLGYPATGLIQYFNAAAYNMKLSGTLASSRAVQSFGAAEAYHADWKTRLSEYNSLGQAATGELSKNIKFSPGFFKTFGTLNFSGQTDIGASQGQVASAIKSGNLSGAEINALNAGVKSAIRRNKDIKKREQFKSVTKNASPELKKLIADNRSALNRLNAPLEQFNLAKLGGGGGGFKKLNNTISGVAQSNQELQKKNQKKIGPSEGLNQFLIKPKQNQAAGFGAYAFVGQSDDLDAGQSSNKDTGLGHKEVEQLLNKLAKEDLDVSEDDTLFTLVSKAYKRNYDKVLHRNKSSLPLEEEQSSKEDKKEQLRRLLEN